MVLNTDNTYCIVYSLRIQWVYIDQSKGVTMQPKQYIGIGFTLLSALSYAGLATFVNTVLPTIPTPILVFFMSAVALLALMPFVLAGGKKSRREIRHSKMKGVNFLRTLFSLGISYFLFSALGKIPVVDAVLFANTAPLLLPFVAWIMLRDKINHRLWAPIVVGFVGVALVLGPGSNLLSLGALLALGSAVCMAASMLLVRKASKLETSLTTVFYYFFFSTVISGLVAIYFWVPLSWHMLMLLLLAGGLFFIVQYALTIAFQFIEAPLASSLYYSNIIFAALLSFILWHTPFSALSLVGIVLTVLGGLLTIHAQTKRQPTVKLRGLHAKATS
jgi:drug/metabolite transporter (DMT)-like permease